MKHLRKRRTLGRKRAQRQALLNGLAAALILNKRIETTLAKAKEMRALTEKLISRAKENTVHNMRIVRKRLPKEATKALFLEVGPHFKERKGGYLRIVKKTPRQSDGALMALVELVDLEKKSEKKAEKKAPKKSEKKMNETAAEKTEVKADKAKASK